MVGIGIDMGNKYTKIYKISDGIPENISSNCSNRYFPTLINIIKKGNQYIIQKCDQVNDSSLNYINKVYNIPELIHQANNVYKELFDPITNNSVFKKYISLEYSFLHILIIFLDYIQEYLKSTDISAVFVYEYLDVQAIEIIKSAFSILNINLLGILKSTQANAISYAYPKIVKKRREYDNYLFLDLGYYNTKLGIYHCNNSCISEYNFKENIIPFGSYWIDLEILKQLKIKFKKILVADVNNKIIDSDEIEFFPKLKLQLWKFCEKIRKDISMNQISSIQEVIYFSDNEYNFNFTIQLKEYQKIISTLIHNLRHFLEKYIKNANILGINIKNVVITGGLYRFLVVKNFLKDVFSNINIIDNLNLEESTARGAVIYSGILNKNNIENKLFRFNLGNNIWIKYNNHKPFILLAEKDYYPVQKSLKLNLFAPFNLSYSYDNVNYIPLISSNISNINEIITDKKNYKYYKFDSINIIFFIDKCKSVQIVSNNIFFRIGNNLNKFKLKYTKYKPNYDNLIKYHQKIKKDQYRLKMYDSLRNTLESTYYLFKSELSNKISLGYNKSSLIANEDIKIIEKYEKEMYNILNDNDYITDIIEIKTKLEYYQKMINIIKPSIKK